MTYQKLDDTEAETGRRTIEITEEMIRAGVHALYARENDEKWTTPQERVCAIYAAMTAARS